MNVDNIREDFPVLKKYTYFDNACMALKPKQVVEAMEAYFLEYPACGERSAHKLGNKVTEEFHNARKTVAKFINAKEEEIIFTKNTSEGLNLLSNALNLNKNDSVIVSDKEHNSNFLPWLKYNRKVIKTGDKFDLQLLEKEIIGAKAVSFLHSSNIDGMTFPIKEITDIAHENKSISIVDGAQSVPHKEIDVKKLGIDALAFSGHKMLGPSIGCLYVKKELMETMKEFMVGGGTILDIVDGKPIYMKGPHRFEPGLQDYAGAIGLKAAIEYLERIGMKNIERHEQELKRRMTEIENIKNVSIIGQKNESGVLSFQIKGIDSKELAIMLDSYNVCVRGGYHCCNNWFNVNNIKGSCRASLYLYNNEKDVDLFIQAVKKVASLS